MNTITNLQNFEKVLTKLKVKTMHEIYGPISSKNKIFIILA